MLKSQINDNDLMSLSPYLCPAGIVTWHVGLMRAGAFPSSPVAAQLGRERGLFRLRPLKLETFPRPAPGNLPGSIYPALPPLQRV